MTFYEEIAECAAKNNLEIGNNQSDLYIENCIKILEIAVKYGKCKKNIIRTTWCEEIIFHPVKTFNSNITGKQLLEFPFEFQPFWDKVSQK
jgi:hypothetical protein